MIKANILIMKFKTVQNVSIRLAIKSILKLKKILIGETELILNTENFIREYRSIIYFQVKIISSSLQSTGFAAGAAPGLFCSRK